MDPQRQGEKNRNSSVVAETKELLANNSYGYHIIDRSRHTVTIYLTDESTHSAITSKMFKHVVKKDDQLYEVRLVNSEKDHKEPIIARFLSLH